MGGRARAKSWVMSFPPPSLAFLRTLARAGSPPRTFARAASRWVNTRSRDPPGLRRRLSRHLPLPSIQPVSRLDFLSWDCPKIAPPSSWRHRSPLPGAALPGRSLRGPPATADPRSALVVFHHLDGFLLRCRARVLQRAPDPGVHPVFGPPAAVSPRRPLRPSPGCFPALRSLPSARSRDCVTGVSPRRSPRPLPPRPSPPLTPTRRHGRPRARVQVGSEGPRGLPPRTGPLPDRRFPASRARCSPGLARIQPASRPANGVGANCSGGTSKTGYCPPRGRVAANP